MTTPARRLCR